MNLLIDGPSRSGKLLLGKLLLASPSLAFQHYSGGLERLLEILYFSNQNPDCINSVSEILRLNLLHTLQDLKNGRLLSVNINDSSFYQKSIFYQLNKASFDDGFLSNLLCSGQYGMILHTHECELFLASLHNFDKANRIMSNCIDHQLAIIRNPAAQALSWLSRRYTDSWSQKDEVSVFTLYQSKYKMSCLHDCEINRFPWYVDFALNCYIDRDLITLVDIDNFKIPDLITLCVCCLTEVYLDAFENLTSGDNSKKSVFFHEKLHDQPCSDIKNIFSLLNLPYDPEVLLDITSRELSSQKFGKSSIQSARELLNQRISLDSIKNILSTTSKKYCDMI